MEAALPPRAALPAPVLDRDIPPWQGSRGQRGRSRRISGRNSRKGCRHQPAPQDAGKVSSGSEFAEASAEGWRTSWSLGRLRPAVSTLARRGPGHGSQVGGGRSLPEGKGGESRRLRSTGRSRAAWSFGFRRASAVLDKGSWVGRPHGGLGLTRLSQVFPAGLDLLAVKQPPGSRWPSSKRPRFPPHDIGNRGQPPQHVPPMSRGPGPAYPEGLALHGQRGQRHVAGGPRRLEAGTFIPWSSRPSLQYECPPETPASSPRGPASRASPRVQPPAFRPFACCPTRLPVLAVELLPYC